MNRLLVVLGTCSGGTSAVAGVLHHLGVDMGFPITDTSARGYPTFEDEDENAYKLDRQEGRAVELGRVDDYRFDLIGYLNHRSLNSEWPAGVKFGPGNVFPYRNDQAVADQISIIRVVRPLDEVVNAELTRQRRMRDERAEPVDDTYLLERAGYCARCWWACEEVCRAIKPVLVVEYGDLLNNPMRTTNELGRVAFGASKTAWRDRIEEAAEFVRRPC